jgi:transposase
MSVSRRSYSTNLTDAEWQILEPLLPLEKLGGRDAFTRCEKSLMHSDIY